MTQVIVDPEKMKYYNQLPPECDSGADETDRRCSSQHNNRPSSGNFCCCTATQVANFEHNRAADPGAQLLPPWLQVRPSVDSLLLRELHLHQKSSTDLEDLFIEDGNQPKAGRSQ